MGPCERKTSEQAKGFSVRRLASEQAKGFYVGRLASEQAKGSDEATKISWRSNASAKMDGEAKQAGAIPWNGVCHQGQECRQKRLADRSVG